MADTSANTGIAPVANGETEFGPLLDVPLTLRVELGRRNMRVRDVLQLRRESIIGIEKSAGENVDIYANDQLIAFGEVLEMEGHAGIRITDLFEQR